MKALIAAACSALLLLSLAPSPGAAPADDPDARALLKDAVAHRATWGADFPGFEAAAEFTIDGKSCTGHVRVSRDRKVEVNLPDEAARREAEEMLGSIVLHRAASGDGGGSESLTFGAEDHHPQGRLIQVGDESHSTYRVRDHQILQVSRSAGPKVRFTIDVLSTERVRGDQFLPGVYTVTYRDAATGALQRTDTFIDRHQEVGSYFLPSERIVLEAGHDHTRTIVLRLREFRLL